ncbi:MAG: efflux RND transporter periplasmic adaptor subunit [Aestuariivirgaceae bacterium]|jgi:HlyD family secretion protein
MRRLVIVLLLIPPIAALAYLYSVKHAGPSYAELLRRGTDGVRRELVQLTNAAMSWRPAADKLPNPDMTALADGVSRAYAGARGLFESTPSRYITAPVERGRFATVVRATGTLNPISTVDVGSELSGRIAEVLVDFNDKVRAGQVLARLDPVTFAARVKEAKASLRIAQAGARVQLASKERATAEIASAKMARNVAEANQAALKAKLAETERDLQRKTILARTTIISKADLTGTQARRDAEAADVLAATEQINMKGEAIVIAEADLRIAEANLDNAEAIVEEKEAALEQAEQDLARTEIRSPTDGVIIKRDINPGQTVAVSLEAKMLFNIANDLREMEVHGKLDEADIGQVKPGQKVAFTVDAYPDRQFTADVRQVRMAHEVVQNVVTYTVVISAPNRELLLFPGMTANLVIGIDESADVLKIPNQALRFRPDGEAPAAESLDMSSGTVWVTDPNRQGPVPVPVALGRSDSNGTELRSGKLREGQPVIVGIAVSEAGAGPFGIRLGY